MSTSPLAGAVSGPQLATEKRVENISIMLVYQVETRASIFNQGHYLRQCFGYKASYSELATYRESCRLQCSMTVALGEGGDFL